jgi:hypothetical protein
VALTNMVLGGLASEDNLLDALGNAQFEGNASYDQVLSDFAQGHEGVASFTYNGIQETLAYVPVEGTDWLLTYLIRESVISESIGTVTDGIVMRSLVQSALTALVLLSLFGFLIVQTRKNAQLALEKETAYAEARARHEELVQRLALQEQLLEQEREQQQQNEQIASSRRSQVGSGDRSQRIRTYNFPQGRVTDHRIGLTLHTLDAFLNGDIGGMIDALISADTAEKMHEQISQE